jgi:hypothetical protein
MCFAKLKVVALSALVIVLGACESSSSDQSVQVEPGAIEAHIRFLADDELEGRETASRGLRVSENYVAAQFRSYGLEAGGDAGTYFQTVPLRQSVQDPAGSRFRVNRDGSGEELTAGTDFFVLPAMENPESSVTAPVIFVGHGLYAPDQDIDDYAGLDVAGNIVAFLGDRPPVFSLLDPHLRLPPSQAADLLGAVASISLSPAEQSEDVFADRAKPSLRPRTSWVDAEGRPYTQARATVGTEIQATLSGSASVRLFRGAQRSYSEVLDEAGSGEGPVAGFELPIEATIGQRSIHTDASSRNVLAILRGSDPELSNEYIVVTSHLDHIGIGEAIDGDSIYNGVMDNATGVAMMLEVARLLALAPDRPRRSVLFFATTAEEHGLVGSSYFVRNPTVPHESMVVNINLDAPRMFFPFDELIAFGAEHSTTMLSALRETAEGLNYTVDDSIWFERGASDHFSFLQSGIPGTRFIPALVSTDPEIDADEIMDRYRPHRPSDDLSMPLDYEVGATFVDIVRATVRRLADAETDFVLNEDDPLFDWPVAR